MVKVVDNVGHMYSFGQAHYLFITEPGALLVLKTTGDAGGATSLTNVVAIFAAQQWQWATTAKPEDEQIPGDWPGAATG